METLIARRPVWCRESAGVDYPPWLLSPQSTRDACRWDGVSMSPLKESLDCRNTIGFASWLFGVSSFCCCFFDFQLATALFISLKFPLNHSDSPLLQPKCFRPFGPLADGSELPLGRWKWGKTWKWWNKALMIPGFYGALSGWETLRCCGSMVKYFAVAAGSHCGYVTCEGQWLGKSTEPTAPTFRGCLKNGQPWPRYNMRRIWRPGITLATGTCFDFPTSWKDQPTRCRICINQERLNSGCLDRQMTGMKLENPQELPSMICVLFSFQIQRCSFFSSMTHSHN